MALDLLSPISAVLRLAGDSAKQAEAARVFKLNRDELTRSMKLSEANAIDALAQGSIQAGAARMKASDAVADQRNEAAESGVLNTGTVANVGRATGIFGALQGLVAENSAARTAMGHREVERGYGVKLNNLIAQRDAQLQSDQIETVSDAVGIASSAGGVATTLLSAGIGGGL